MKPSKLALASLVAAFLLLALLIPHTANAQLINPGGGGGGLGSVNGGVNNGRFGPQIVTIILRIIDVLIGVVGVVMVILLVVSGIRFMTSVGDPKALQAARNSAIFAVLGLAIVLLAVTIVVIIGQFTGVNTITNLNFCFTSSC
jgi:hypothetical protein